MSVPTDAELTRLRALVPAGDTAWIAKAGDVPLLKLPAEVFAWDERMVYFANTGVFGAELWLEVRAFDGVAREAVDPNEIDWCIPAAYDGAPEIERLGWTIGWGEGWSDSQPVLRTRFGAAFSGFFADAARGEQLAIATVGRRSRQARRRVARGPKFCTGAPAVTSRAARRAVATRA